MRYYNENIEQVLKELKTTKEGLDIKEAQKRLEKDGLNILKENKKESKFKKFLEEFKDLMIIVLLIVALFSFILAIVKDESFIDSIVILAIVIMNAILGFLQELKADKAIDALNKSQVTKVKVKRNNKVMIIKSEELVKGDILLVEPGDKVTVDARIIYAASLKAQEAALTGESIPVEKDIKTLSLDTPLAQRSNMLYAGTNIVYGKGIAVVCKTKDDTEFGMIAKSLENQEKEITPLQKKINDISKFLTKIVMVIIGLMIIIGILKDMKLMEVIMLAISLAVAAIPEGLPAIITITLSLGMGVMAKKKAIVRKMASIETLGCTDIICTDKTGTITQNKMKVEELYFDNKLWKYNELKKDNLLLQILALNNDAEKNEEEYIGDPTEIALYECCSKYLDVRAVQMQNERIGELPFDSERKMMSTINKCNDKIRLYIKGSFDSLITRCKFILEDNKVKKLTKKKKEELKNIEILESNKAYRILAYGYKEIEGKFNINKELENDLIFVGLTAMIDPPRSEVKEAIALCKTAHIKPIMITGDSLDTAKAIAKEVGIMEDDREAILGYELDKMNELELRENIAKYSVYARVSPINKLSIVKAWKEKGKVVAMAGDGINDAPAIKSANIGIGMGITGTEVSKNVADIVLSDDSFATIVTAVQEGRRIFDNIRNVLVYLLAANIAEVLIVFIGMILGVEIFLPIQLLYINLITDSLPAIALAFEDGDEDLMKRKVRKKDSSFFTPFLLAKILTSAIIKMMIILIVYFVNLKVYDVNVASTMAFLTLILQEIIFAYSCRNLKNSVLNKKLGQNKILNRSILVLAFIQLLVFISPIKYIFGITSLSLIQVTYVILVVILAFLVDEFLKKIIVKLFKD